MNKLVLLSVLIGISGCTTIPQKQKFPDPPGADSMTQCPPLNALPKDPKLSDVSKTIISNYTLYHQCSVKSDSWIEWYNTQKKIYENIGKK